MITTNNLLINHCENNRHHISQRELKLKIHLLSIVQKEKDARAKKTYFCTLTMNETFSVLIF